MADIKSTVAQAVALLDRVMSPESSSWLVGTVQMPGSTPDMVTLARLHTLAALLYVQPPVFRFGCGKVVVPPDLEELANSLEDGGLRGYVGTGAHLPGTRVDTGAEAAELVRELFGLPTMA